MLGLSPPDDAVLLSDGYAAYSSYAEQVGLATAQCWAHARREVFEAKNIEPALAEKGARPHRRAEMSARHFGIVQSILVRCRLHDVDPYDYLVDVLRRVGQHPASLVEQLTPRVWKTLFANNPMRSDLYQRDT